MSSSPHRLHGIRTGVPGSPPWAVGELAKVVGIEHAAPHEGVPASLIRSKHDLRHAGLLSTTKVGPAQQLPGLQVTCRRLSRGGSEVAGRYAVQERTQRQDVGDLDHGIGSDGTP